jgi:hypothetical protein
VTSSHANTHSIFWIWHTNEEHYATLNLSSTDLNEGTYFNAIHSTLVNKWLLFCLLSTVGVICETGTNFPSGAPSFSLFVHVNYCLSISIFCNLFIHVFVFTYRITMLSLRLGIYHVSWSLWNEWFIIISCLPLVFC